MLNLLRLFLNEIKINKKKSIASNSKSISFSHCNFISFKMQIATLYQSSPRYHKEQHSNMLILKISFSFQQSPSILFFLFRTQLFVFSFFFLLFLLLLLLKINVFFKCFNNQYFSSFETFIYFFPIDNLFHMALISVQP